jgi:hypothetical protein
MALSESFCVGLANCTHTQVLMDVGVDVPFGESKDLGGKADVGNPLVVDHRLDGALAYREPPGNLRFGFVVRISERVGSLRFTVYFLVVCHVSLRPGRLMQSGSCEHRES